MLAVDRVDDSVDQRPLSTKQKRDPVNSVKPAED